MLILGPIGFATPWLLLGLAGLPLLWLILRAMPPAPRVIDFPAVALLLGLRDKVPVARHTPWWLLLIRLLALAVLISGLAGPVWKPVLQDTAEDGPLLVIVDGGWAAAGNWAERQVRAARALDQAARAGRPAALLIADGWRGNDPLVFQPAGDLRAGLRAAQPASWSSRLSGDPAAALVHQPSGTLSTLWVADGLDYPGHGDWLAELKRRGPVMVVPPARPVLSLTLEGEEDPTLILHGQTADPPPDILAIGPDPQGIERPLARLTAGELLAGATALPRRSVAIDLPPELRNRILRFQIEGQSTAGAVVLADDRVRRKKIALVGDADDAAEGQKLLSPLHYLRQALSPSNDLIEGGLGDVLETAPDVIVLVDQVEMPEAARLTEWVENGGLLIRFAGPRMAASEHLDADPLLPVRLRPGGRDIGGALSWADPRGLAPFADDSLFAGLNAPADVTIRAQLMAQPGPDLAALTIAALADNTPLITRDRRGQGQVVLIHVTANAEWSNWPLSGLFVQMMDRLVSTARLATPAEVADDLVEPDFWTPETVLNGFGRAAALGDLAPVAAVELARGPSPGQPAGIYVAGERRKALNAGQALVPADWPDATIESITAHTGRDLKPLLLVLAALLLALDALASALLARGGRRHGMAAVLVLLALMLPVPRAQAQEEVPQELQRAANEVALAYVLTGDEALDQTSYDGLRGLSRMLNLRTSVEPGVPVGIDLDHDDLSVLSFLYWPISAEQPRPSPIAYLRLNHFLRSGGMILFDTRDGDIAGVGGPDRSAALQALAAPLDIPPLAPVPDDHVLTRSFYLLDGFPGRWHGRDIWAEAPPIGVQALEGMPFRDLNDGVSPVIIGGNSWAEAWAIDDDGMPIFPVGRGFEGEEQREMAFRFGINLVVYVLTGNYKSDQVHVPALLERLRIEEVTR